MVSEVVEELLLVVIAIMFVGVFVAYGMAMICPPEKLQFSVFCNDGKLKIVSLNKEAIFLQNVKITLLGKKDFLIKGYVQGEKVVFRDQNNNKLGECDSNPMYFGDVIELNISSIPAGTYYVTLVYEEKSFSFVISKD